MIEKNVPYATRLPIEDRDELFGHVQVFLVEKRFEGAAEASRSLTRFASPSLLKRACSCCIATRTTIPNLVTILVYPSTYLVPGSRTPDGLVPDAPQARLGESWARDLVVLAWDSVLAGAVDVHDGHNVVLHEFAHQLDQESGAAN